VIRVYDDAGNVIDAHEQDYAKFYSCSHDAVIRLYDHAGNIIQTHGADLQRTSDRGATSPK
jgi:hypothetical protein